MKYAWAWKRWCLVNAKIWTFMQFWWWFSWACFSKWFSNQALLIVFAISSNIIYGFRTKRSTDKDAALFLRGSWIAKNQQFANSAKWNPWSWAQDCTDSFSQHSHCFIKSLKLKSYAVQGENSAAKGLWNSLIIFTVFLSCWLLTTDGSLNII